MSAPDLCTCGGMTDTCDGCPDCLGVGCKPPVTLTPSEQARADATADAETLMLNWWGNPPNNPFLHEPLTARDYGMQAIYHLEHAPTFRWSDLCEWEAINAARLAARAAFRACPALREA